MSANLVREIDKCINILHMIARIALPDDLRALTGFVVVIVTGMVMDKNDFRYCRLSADYLG